MEPSIVDTNKVTDCSPDLIISIQSQKGSKIYSACLKFEDGHQVSYVRSACRQMSDALVRKLIEKCLI